MYAGQIDINCRGSDHSVVDFDALEEPARAAEGGDPVSSSGGVQDSGEPVSTGGGSGDGPLGPGDPGGPNHEWFREGTIEPRKFERYLFDPHHRDNEGKAEGWRKVFGLGSGDAEAADRLIREQLDQAEIVEQEPRGRYRRWELLVPDCEGPNGNVAPLLTAWALDPDKDRPHLSTAFPRPE